ncbi:hypothetical protein ACFQ0B_50005 [Nonomuraea thailandensis]
MDEQGFAGPVQHRVGGVGRDDGDPRGQPFAMGVGHGERLGGDDELDRVVRVQLVTADRAAVQQQAGTQEAPAAPGRRHHTAFRPAW